MVWVAINLLNIDNFVPCCKCFCYIYVQGAGNSSHPLKIGEFPCPDFYEVVKTSRNKNRYQQQYIGSDSLEYGRSKRCPLLRKGKEVCSTPNNAKRK